MSRKTNHFGKNVSIPSEQLDNSDDTNLFCSKAQKMRRKCCDACLQILVSSKIVSPARGALWFSPRDRFITYFGHFIFSTIEEKKGLPAHLCIPNLEESGGWYAENISLASFRSSFDGGFDPNLFDEISSLPRFVFFLNFNTFGPRRPLCHRVFHNWFFITSPLLSLSISTLIIQLRSGFLLSRATNFRSHLFSFLVIFASITTDY